jgi:hypothetical protein
MEDERERLKVDLGDKAVTIRRLLDENERLSYQLTMAEEKADI